METFNAFSVTLTDLCKCTISDQFFGLKDPIAPLSRSKSGCNLEMAKKLLILVVIVWHCTENRPSGCDL